MTTTQWIVTLVVTLIAGGAMGSVIGIISTNRRNRIQPVGVKTEVLEVFSDKLGLSELEPQITVQAEGTQYTFNNLYLFRYSLINKGNKDMESFKFGLTLSKSDMPFGLTAEGRDRHHQIIPLRPVTIDPPTLEIDLELKPFNRRDIYSFSFFITIDEDQPYPNAPVLTSPYPVTFVNMSTGSTFELTDITTKGISINLAELYKSIRNLMP